ncbi:MAG: hypothetical protein HOE45_09540 [Gammaproteobacteria bacterium]|jgi:uncharacterized membrane protein|nr:hypothetical protein [Gammaproteobacteria bacterium]MBT4147095.1 hypothetical protein [Gammaproteobacteria bacterium]MBT5222068.1 hypothetical protein [Gammaproteobacteria bacterium]MBT5825655.1 hypothetical protein [Gammaproteobacteria bacterium]MBT5967308.1 hypothetical protein [Gammaproteobacteria bacterium]
MKTLLRIIISIMVFLLYPYLVYRGVQEGVVWFAPAAIASVYFYQAVNARNRKIRIQKLAIVLMLFVGAIYFQDTVAKLVPIIIQLSLMLFFGKTLLPNKGPSLVERFASLEFPVMPPVLMRYCRHLTVMWTGFFAFNVLACLYLALFAPVQWWAIYTGVLIFVLTALIMIAEYIWRFFMFRRIDLPAAQIPGIKETVKMMFINGRKIWLDIQAS